MHHQARLVFFVVVVEILFPLHTNSGACCKSFSLLKQNTIFVQCTVPGRALTPGVGSKVIIRIIRVY
jgi:hypothetical protein